ncbi:MAG: porin family protein [Runella zeae]
MILFISKVYSQNSKPDLIYRLDQSVIKATVVEVTDQEVVYQSFGDKKGQKLKLSVKSISKIVYANGDIEAYNDIAVQPKPVSAKSDKIVLKNRQHIEGTIVEIDEKSVRYKRKGQSQISQIYLKEIAEIRYNNGDVEHFNSFEAVSATSSTRRFGMYINGGLNIAHQTFPTILQNLIQPIRGYRATLGAWYQMNKHWALRLEATYAQQGMRLAFENDYEQLIANYLKVPLLIQVQKSLGKVGLFANIGGFGGYWLNAKTTSLQNQQKSNTPYKFNQFADKGISDNRMEYGLAGGGGLWYQISKKGSLLLETRYDYGLSNISKYDPQPDEYSRVSNRALGVTLGYRFHF